VQTEKLTKLKAERNAEAVSSALSDLAKAAASTENLMPYILQAVEVYATLGEIADTLRNEFGEY
jgi:methylmalonyl-CoA mutase N-terminal domain/subunit